METFLPLAAKDNAIVPAGAAVETGGKPLKSVEKMPLEGVGETPKDLGSPESPGTSGQPTAFVRVATAGTTAATTEATAEATTRDTSAGNSNENSSSTTSPSTTSATVTTIAPASSLFTTKPKIAPKPNLGGHPHPVLGARVLPPLATNTRTRKHQFLLLKIRLKNHTVDYRDVLILTFYWVMSWSVSVNEFEMSGLIKALALTQAVKSMTSSKSEELFLSQ
jgi:hypothetical protein